MLGLFLMGGRQVVLIVLAMFWYHVQIKKGTMRSFERVSVPQDCIFLFGKRRRLANFWTPVPSKEEAMENYALLGGVARYVLCSTNTSARSTELLEALRQFDVAYCWKMLKNDFDALPTTRDVLVHMTCGPIFDGPHGKYGTRDLKLATSGVKLQVITALDKEYKSDTVKILKELISCTGAESYFGYIFELVEHYIHRRWGILEEKGSRWRWC